MIARGRAHGAESWSDQEIRKAIEDDNTTVTLTDATVFPPGSPRYEVPLLRIRLCKSPAGGSFRPTPKARRRSRTRRLVSSRLPPPPSEATRSTARPLSTPVPHWRCPMLAQRYQTAIVVDPDRYIEHVFDSPGFRLSEPGLRQGRGVSGC